MIDYIIPLPHRAELLGSSIGGLTDSFGVLSDPVKAAISREVAVLPFRFYKVVSSWGSFSCEHIIASDKTVDVLNLNENTGPIIPISVKIKEMSLQLHVDHTFLFVNGINYLLTKYPKQWQGDDIIPRSGIINPVGITKIMPISVWAMRKYYEWFDNGSPNDTVIQVPDKCWNTQTINMADPFWNLVETNDSSAMSMSSVISDGCGYGNTEPIDGVHELIQDILGTQACNTYDFFVLEFHNVKHVDPLTRIFLKNPWFSTWEDINGYLGSNNELRLGWWNLANAQANSTINFKGSPLPLLIANADWDVMHFLSMVVNTGISDFCVEVNGGCRPKIAINDPTYSGTIAELQGFADIIGNYLCEMFVSLHDTPQYLKGHSVTITKTFLDEIFIVVEGNFGRYCYYVSIPYYCLTSPVLCNAVDRSVL